MRLMVLIVQKGSASPNCRRGSVRDNSDITQDLLVASKVATTSIHPVLAIFALAIVREDE